MPSHRVPSATTFPVHAFARGDDGTLVCGCSKSGCTRWGKCPAKKYSQLERGEQIPAHVGGGLALLTGWKSGVFVVDTDGPEAEGAYVAAHPDDPATFTVATPSGGKHRYYAWPGFFVKTSQSELAPKVDIRGDLNGYVMLPGSPHKSGGEYTIEQDVAVATAPAWLLEWPGLKGRALTDGIESVYPVVPVDLDSDLGRDRMRMGREACASMPPAIEGQNGSGALWNLALRLIRDLELPIDAAHSLVSEVYNRRCEPEWSPEQIEHKLKDARDKSDRFPGLASDLDLDRSLREHYRAKAAQKTGRRVHDPKHRHTVFPGQKANVDPTKIGFNEACAILWGDCPEWDGVLAFDEIRGEVVAVDPPTPLDAERADKGFSNEDVDRIVHWFSIGGQTATRPMTVAREHVERAAVIIAKRRSFNPIREYLEGLTHVHGAIDAMATEALGISAEDSLSRAYVRRFLMAAVRRALVPGTKVDTVLTLHGDPGLRKSFFVSTLFSDAWSSDSVGSLDDEKSVGEKLAGKWGVELGELKDIMRAGNETVAQFITRRSDRYRGAYARGNAKDQPRTCVFVGTTNETEILRNASGADARRFWIVSPSKKIDLSWVEKNRDAVWGEAYALAMTDEQHWLTDEEETLHVERAKLFQAREAWHDKIADFIVGKEWVAAEDVFKAVNPNGTWGDRKDLLKVTDTLRRLKCKSEKIGSGLRARKVWLVPAELRDLSVIEPKKSDNPFAGAARVRV